MLRLGVNIDHVATIRNARGTPWPDPLVAARLAQDAGADGITAHLREDRRHILDEDIKALATQLTVPLNFEMAATAEMQAIALRYRPHAVCIVPEKRQERTTEGGLDVIGQKKYLAEFIAPLRQAGCRVSVFIGHDAGQIRAAADIGAAVVELHTGSYCDFDMLGQYQERDAELAALRQGAALAADLGLEVHAGHGLTCETVGPIAAIAQLVELNIGHSLIAQSVYVGLSQAIWDMRQAMNAGRHAAV